MVQVSRQRHNTNAASSPPGLTIGIYGLLLALPGPSFAPRGAAQEAPEAAVILVTSLDERSPDDHQDLSPTTGNRAVRTLAQALHQAAADPRDNVIRFAPDLFKGESATVKLEAPVLIRGSAAGHDCLDGSSAATTITIDVADCREAGLIVAGDASFTIRQLIITSGQQRNLLVKDQATLTLDRVVVSSAEGPGIACFEESSVHLRQCRLANNRTHGVEVHDAASATMDYVDLRRNGQSGCAMFGSSRAEINDSYFDANGDWNIVMTAESRARLTRCLLRKARFANADISGRAFIDFDDCTLDAGERFGLFATGDADVRMRLTGVSQAGSRGVELQNRARLSMRDSHVEFSNDYGIILFGQSHAQLFGTRVARNGAHGISMRDEAAASIIDCTLSHNRYSGVGCLDRRDGGDVHVSRSVFQRNGMRPLYRGPLHLDPLVPTPLRIQGDRVICRADPHAEIELFLDRVGEASRYLRSVRADGQGLFTVDTAEIPAGWVMTASATVDRSTSEFNVVAGAADTGLMSAILGRTGPLSDAGGRINDAALLRRWKPGTYLLFHMPSPPSAAVEAYARFFVEHVQSWTAGAATASLEIGSLDEPPAGSVVIPLNYVSADDSELLGRGGVTYMKWDASGFFQRPMEILLARGRFPEETCPRVLAHEIGHTLGLSHARVGLLSRMQGSKMPVPGFVNDFSPTMTYYDVLALHMLYDAGNGRGATLQDLADRGLLGDRPRREIVGIDHAREQPSFSPPAHDASSPTPQSTARP